MSKVLSWNDLQQILLTAAPIVALLIAWSGLNTWKRQLKGTHDFELSRRLLLTLYKCRDALKSARNSFLQPGESDKDRNDWEASAYENRWKVVSEAMSELRVTTLESEASWGEDFYEEADGLHKLTVKLMLAIRHYLASQQKGPNSKLFSEKDEKALWGTENDEYEKELNTVVEAFEKKIKPKLGRK